MKSERDHGEDQYTVTKNGASGLVKPRLKSMWVPIDMSETCQTSKLEADGGINVSDMESEHDIWSLGDYSMYKKRINMTKRWFRGVGLVNEMKFRGAEYDFMAPVTAHDACLRDNVVRFL